MKKADRENLTQEDKKASIRQFAGEGKVIILEKRAVESGDGRTISWKVDYEENGRVDFLVFDDEVECDQYIDEFRGKNNKTVAAEDKYLTLNGWTGKDLKKAGFALRHMRLRIAAKNNTDIKTHIIPKTCGEPYFPNKATGKTKKRWEVKERSLLTSEINIFANWKGRSWERQMAELKAWLSKGGQSTNI